jgi:hypothetical protein
LTSKDRIKKTSIDGGVKAIQKKKKKDGGVKPYKR